MSKNTQQSQIKPDGCNHQRMGPPGNPIGDGLDFHGRRSPHSRGDGPAPKIPGGRRQGRDGGRGYHAKMVG